MSPLNSIRSWPCADRPREKLLSLGEQSLTDSELLTILIGSGTKGTSALDLAKQILVEFGPLGGLSAVSSKQWRMFKGLGPAKVARIRAAIEIGRRLNERPTRLAQAAIESSKDIAQMLMGRMRDLKKEVVKAVFLNSQNKIISIVQVEEGTVNCAHPILREIFAGALELGASAMICVHNHPSGDPSPSPEDRQFTQELRQAGGVLGVAVLDHIIIGDNAYYSFADNDE